MVKELHEMTIQELWELFPIILKEYNPEYVDWYSEEAQNIKNIVDSSHIARINHIGSTAVPDLIAKPTVDMLLEINPQSDIKKVRDIISDNGWILMRSRTEPMEDYVFNKGYTKYGFAEKVYHLHMRYLGDWDKLYFRDYLLDNKDVADEYGRLKVSLLEEYKNDRDGYTDAKGEFIKEWTKRAREEYGGRYDTFVLPKV